MQKLKENTPDEELKALLLLASRKNRKGEPKASILIVMIGNQADLQLIEGSRLTRYLVPRVAACFGLRQGKHGVIMGGHGYSRSMHLASSLTALAGKPLHFQTLNESHPDGWVQP